MLVYYTKIQIFINCCILTVVFFFILLTLSVTKLLKWNASPQVSGWSVRRIIVSRALATYLSLRHIL
jgi:hypothetical protein